MAFKPCWPLKTKGEPPKMPCNLPNAISDPENVIAPTAAPKDISTKLTIRMLPKVPIPYASGAKNAARATNTAASPTNE